MFSKWPGGWIWGRCSGRRPHCGWGRHDSHDCRSSSSSARGGGQVFFLHHIFWNFSWTTLCLGSFTGPCKWHNRWCCFHNQEDSQLSADEEGWSGNRGEQSRLGWLAINTHGQMVLPIPELVVQLLETWVAWSQTKQPKEQIAYNI